MNLASNNELDSTSTNSPVYRAGIPDVTTLFQEKESVFERSPLSPRNRPQRPLLYVFRFKYGLQYSLLFFIVHNGLWKTKNHCLKEPIFVFRGLFDCIKNDMWYCLSLFYFFW